jgi:regulator of sigma E protease
VIGTGIVVLAFALSLCVSVAARAVMVRMLGVSGTTIWLGPAPLRWTSRGLGKYALVVAASAASSYLVAASFVVAGALDDGIERSDPESMRVQVGPGGPAALAGIREGDRVLAVDGVRVDDWDALKSNVRSHAGESVAVSVERDGATVVVPVTPNADGKILIGPAIRVEHPTVARALAMGLVTPPAIWSATSRGIARAVTGTERVAVSGAGGIVRESSRQGDRGVGRAIAFAGALSSYFFPWMLLFALIGAPLGRGKRARSR